MMVIGPHKTAHQYKQLQMSVLRYGPGSGQDSCHLQRHWWHPWDEGAPSERRNAPPKARDRTRRFVCALQQHHADRRTPDSAWCSTMLRSCEDSAVQIFVGADRNGARWSLLLSAIGAILTLFGPSSSWSSDLTKLLISTNNSKCRCPATALGPA